MQDESERSTCRCRRMLRSSRVFSSSSPCEAPPNQHNTLSQPHQLVASAAVLFFLLSPLSVFITCTAAIYTTGSTGFLAYKHRRLLLLAQVPAVTLRVAPRLIQQDHTIPYRNTGGASSLHCGVGVDFHRQLSLIEAAKPVSPCASPLRFRIAFLARRLTAPALSFHVAHPICGFLAVPYSNIPLFSHSLLLYP